MLRDFSLALDPKTRVMTAHAVDCPEVRRQAAEGEPVMTLLQCAREPAGHLPRHECLLTPAAK